MMQDLDEIERQWKDVEGKMTAVDRRVGELREELIKVRSLVWNLMTMQEGAQWDTLAHISNVLSDSLVDLKRAEGRRR